MSTENTIIGFYPSGTTTILRLETTADLVKMGATPPHSAGASGPTANCNLTEQFEDAYGEIDKRLVGAYAPSGVAAAAASGLYIVPTGTITDLIWHTNGITGGVAIVTPIPTGSISF